MNILSRIEEWVLLAVLNLGDDAYGAAIHSYLISETGEDWSIASVYTALDRLAKRRFLRTFRGAPTPERGGRSRKMYTLTAAGHAELHRVHVMASRLWSHAGF